MKKKSLFWADQLADLIIKRDKYNHINKKFTNPKILTIKSSTSISGVPHIGNASDVIRHDAVVKALKDKGKKVKFIWVAEDMDPWRKVPRGIPEMFSKYIGMPVSSLPDPDGCCKNYVKHYVNLFLDSLKESFGTNPKFLSTTDAYKKGVFNKQIKKCVENLDEVKKIVGKFRKDKLPEDYSPWKPVCDKCGKLITTRIKEVKEDGVDYECKDYEFKEYGKEAYNKVKGCGYKGFSDIKKGNGKLLWNCEWAAEWDAWKVVLEGAGKEHFMPTSSFWRAGEICEKIFGWIEPYPGKNPIQPYEYIMFNEAKMSASKGNVIATWDWDKFAPAELLRLLFLKKPNKVRDFKLADVGRSVDEIDKLERIYFNLDKESEEEDSKRLFEMVSIKISNKYKNPINFNFLAMLSQVYDSFDKCVPVLKKLDHEIVDKKFSEKRFEQAKEWVEKYGPDYMRFEVVDKVNVEISKDYKEALLELADKLEKGKYNEENLFNEFYEICNSKKLDNKEFFKAAYKVLINRERGPRLASFILAIGKDKVVKLLKQVK